MIKVLQISKYLYPFIGGIEQVARDISSALPKEEYEQKIICFNEDAKDGEYVCKREETSKDTLDGIDVIRCGCIAKLASQSISLTYAAQLKDIMDTFHPDIVIFHYPNPFVSTLFMRYLERDFKLILFWHYDITKQKILRTFFARQSNRLLQRADVVWSTSPNHVEGSPYLHRVRDKCVLVPPCINEKRLEMTDEAQKLAKKIRNDYPNKIICLAVGRHTKYKGFHYLIQAAKQLDDRFEIFMIGKGEETARLKKEATGDAKIHFLGAVDDNILKAYLTAMDIFCFPSITKNEAFGLALAEAMYFGKPAVTFHIEGSGVNYVCLDGEDGIEVKNRDVSLYADALKMLADHPEMRKKMGENARKRVEENFLYKQFEEKIREKIF